MTRYEVEKRMSELREIANNPDADEAKVLEARKKLQELEKEFRKALEAEQEAVENKVEETRSLHQEALVSRYMQKFVQGDTLDGAERELNQELNVGMNQMPLSMLEVRTDDPTSVAAAVKEKTRQGFVPRVFDRTDANWLGIEMPSVGAGEKQWTTMATGGTAGMYAENAAVEADAATFTEVSVDPSRLSGRYKFPMEALTRLSDLEARLTEDMRNALADQLDVQLVTGDGTGANVKGYLHADNVDTISASPNALAKVSDFDAAVSAGIDGKWAESAEGIRFLTTWNTYRYMRSNRLDTGEQRTLLEATMDAGGEFRGSRHVAQVNATIQRAWRIRDREMLHYAPIWNAITMIRDPYTEADKATVALTWHMLFGAVRVRGKSQEVRFKTS